MVSTTTSCLIIGMVVLSMVASSYQLKCYSCGEDTTNSRKMPFAFKLKDLPDPPNNVCDGFTDSELMTCPASSEVCYKIDGVSSAGSAAIHMCGDTEALCTAMDGIVDQGLTISCTACNTDGCNGASAISFATTTSLFLLATFIAKFY